MPQRVWKVMLAPFIAIILVGCSSGGSASDPTRSSEDVLETAKAVAEITRHATFQTPPPTPVTPSPTIPPFTETPVPTGTPLSATPMVTSNYNAYVRVSPSEDQAHLGFFLLDQSAVVVGKFENSISGTWWLIRRVDESKDGWVWGGAVTFIGDESVVPLIETMP